MEDVIIPYESKLAFKTFTLSDDVVVHVRQPHKENPYYQVLMEDAYGNSSAQSMTPTQLWEKWRIKL